MADVMKEIGAPIRAAVQRYDMIQQGDKVAVGVSGGKDSVTLLTVLASLRRYYPMPFTLTAITLDPCFNGVETDYTPIAELCESLEVPYVLKRTRLWEVVFEERKDQNPCSLCARMRRGALHKAAQENNCNIVALGHHLDDAAETFLMNLLSGGTLGCFSPKTYLDRRDITLIRPLIFLKESEVAAAARRLELPIVKSQCPVDGCTNRQQTKQLIADLEKQYDALPEKIIGAMQKNQLSGW